MTRLPARTPRCCGCFGFTLLEMMVVMVLLGLLTTMVLPSMQRWHDGVQTRSRVAAIVEALQAAAFAAPAGRKRLVMDDGSFIVAAPPAEPGVAASGPSAAAAAAVSSPLSSTPADAVNAVVASAAAASSPDLLRLELPSGWQAVRVRRAEFLPNGLCVPGFASLRTERGAAVVVAVDGPVCSVATRASEPAR